MKEQEITLTRDQVPPASPTLVVRLREPLNDGRREVECYGFQLFSWKERPGEALMALFCRENTASLSLVVEADCVESVRWVL